ncbi:MAG: LEPR-XLL domain-containing protein, partial [Verrucomicrobiota bacterium]
MNILSRAKALFEDAGNPPALHAEALEGRILLSAAPVDPPTGLIGEEQVQSRPLEASTNPNE